MISLKRAETWDSPQQSLLRGGSVIRNLPANAGDLSLIPGSGRSPGEGNGYLLQYSWGFFGGLDDKENASNAGNLGLSPGSGRSPGKENGYLL